MREQIDAIISDLRALIKSGKLDEQSLDQIIEAFKALEPVTELDRQHLLTGYVDILNILLFVVSDEEEEQLEAQRDILDEQIERRYGSAETPYLRSRAIIREAVLRLVGGGNVDEVVPEALAEIEALRFAPLDRSEKDAAMQAVEAMGAAHKWLTRFETDPQKGDMSWFAWRLTVMMPQLTGLKRDALLSQAKAARKTRLSFDGTPRGHASVLRILYGVGLGADPTALPWLEPVHALWMEALAEAREAAPDYADMCVAILAEFERGLNEDGFSEYLWLQAVASLKELDAQQYENEDGLTQTRALMRLCELSIPHAPEEFAQSLELLRQSFIQMLQDMSGPPKPPISAEELRLELEKLLQRLRDDLASGVLPTPALMRWQMGMQGLIMFRSDEDVDGDEVGKIMARMMPEVIATMAQYAEPDKAELAEDATLWMRQQFREFEEALEVGEQPGRDEVLDQAMAREGQRMLQNPTADSWEQPDALPHQRQYTSLFRPLSRRITALLRLRNAGPRETAEAKRIHERAEIALTRMRAATTEKQMIECQRGSLRRVAVELRQFDRRSHLMLIEPPWPTYPTVVDPNAVFFSGSADVGEAVGAACARIGMAAPEAMGANDPTHTRWDMLRRSAVAAFDFTTYDRAASDPSGALPRFRDKLAAVAQAAATTASVCYECGWALVLGTPMVIIARKRQDVPFDIDVEPVRLADDPMAIILGLQKALYGVQRGVKTGDLGATLARLHERLADDAHARTVLDALGRSRDAIEVQLAADTLIERNGSRGLMLSLPVFPPAYPAADGRRRLFHVTAFRKWSKPCEEVVREACVRAGIEYTIGYERLNPDILHAIWRDIAAASLVVADLTCLNPNAVLELGMAHALGRPTLVLSRTPDLPRYLPALAKVRVHSYDTGAAGKQNLARMLERFFRDDPSVT